MSELTEYPCCNIAYLIPEYPGQTHTFFWRELKAIRQLGVNVQVFSTRKPPEKIITHDWAALAMAETDYLFPPGMKLFLQAWQILLSSGPAAWGRCLKAMWQADVPSIKERLRLIPLVLIGAELAALVRAHNLTHVHVHMCGDVANIAMFANLLQGVPYSLTLHNSLQEFGFNQKWKWRFASFAVVISRKHLQEIQEELTGFLPNRIAVAPMGVDLDTWKKPWAYQPYDGTGECRIFSCGRINPQKNHEDLVRALARVRSQGLNAHLTIAGGDDTAEEIFKKKLVNLISELQLDDFIKLLGPVPESIVKGELARAHIFALASIHEGVPVSVMEAMAMELPVVVTDVGGMRELVDDGKDGFIVMARNPEVMAEKIIDLLTHSNKAKKFSRAARKKITTSFYSSISAETIAGMLGCLSEK